MADLATLISKVAALVDPPGHWLTSSPIVVIANLAVQEFESRMQAANVRTLLTNEVELTATTTMTKFTSGTTPALPATFGGPLLVWEKPAASGTYAPCHSQDVVTDTTAPAASLGKGYVWRNREFLFGAGAIQTASCKVRIVYWVKAVELALLTDTVPYSDLRAIEILVFFMAAEASRSRGQLNIAEAYDAKAQKLIDLVAMGEKESQKAKPQGLGGG